MGMNKKTAECIEKYKLINDEDNVIVALSGGADSVALFHFLLNEKSHNLNIAAAHFEHGLRGNESLQDAEFVSKLCKNYGVKLYIKSGNMQKRQRPPNLSEEEWARILRYDFFEELAKTHSAKIATAHTLSDNAETVIFHAVRGSGPRGLAGIPPKREFYIRPLIFVSRNEVEAYCAENKLDYVIDSTNKDKKYARNRLRSEILPALELVHEGAAVNIARLAGDMLEISNMLDEMAAELLASALNIQYASEEKQRKEPRKFIEKLRTHAHYVGLDAKVLRNAPQPVLMQALSCLIGIKARKQDLYKCIDIIFGIQSSADIHGRLSVSIFKEKFYLIDKSLLLKKNTEEHALRTGKINIGGVYELDICVQKSNKECAQNDTYAKKSEKDLTFAINCDKISKNSFDFCKNKNFAKFIGFDASHVFRTRREGDLYRPAKRNLSKSLKKFMLETAVPAHLRDELPVLANGNNILWIYGIGFSEECCRNKDCADELISIEAHCTALVNNY